MTPCLRIRARSSGRAGAGPFTIAVTRGSSAPRTTSRTLADALEINPDDVVVDVGCGSGVLSFVAARLGAKRGLSACDLPSRPWKPPANALRLGLADRTEFRAGNLLEPVRDMKASVIIGDVSGIPDEIARVAGWFPDGRAGGPTGAELPAAMLESLRDTDCLAKGGRLYLPTGTIQAESRILDVARRVFGDREPAAPPRAVVPAPRRWWPSRRRSRRWSRTGSSPSSSADRGCCGTCRSGAASRPDARSVGSSFTTASPRTPPSRGVRLRRGRSRRTIRRTPLRLEGPRRRRTWCPGRADVLDQRDRRARGCVPLHLGARSVRLRLLANHRDRQAGSSADGGDEEHRGALRRRESVDAGREQRRDGLGDLLQQVGSARNRNLSK